MLFTGLSLKFFGLSEIRSDSPYFQAKLEASRSMQDVMSRFESRIHVLAGCPATAKVLVL
jgi:predicted component of type VI protein secretion system